mgnify:CR=1 FL=1
MAERKKNTAQFNIEQINAQYGKLPPQAVEVEEAVLGALMLERDAYVTVADFVDTHSFYKEEHQKISSLLAGYAKLATEFVEHNHYGKTVYAGGDDFLGFINLNHVFKVMEDLRELSS